MSNFFDKYELYTEGDSIYCYPNTSVLKNKLGIQDYKTLREAESAFVATRLLELEINPIAGRFDIKHLYLIHKYLFQDIYEFAGKTRKEDISKGSTKFCVHLYISEQLEELFNKIDKRRISKSDSKKSLIEHISYLMAELNIIHPFREGNGRAIREFIREYALWLNLNINWSKIEKEVLLDAMIESVYNTEALNECLNMLIE